MRRTLGYVCFIAGGFLIFLAPFLRLYTLPRVEKAPIDVYQVNVSDGTGYAFSAKSFSVVGPVPVSNVSIYRANKSASSHSVAVIESFSRTLGRSQLGDIDYAVQTYAMDRKSGYAVQCCGAKPHAEGVTLKFPFDTQKSTYPLYDATAKKAFPAKYARTEVLDGVKTYVFVSDIPKTLLKTMALPGFVAGESTLPTVTVDRWYEGQTTVWIEPTTGAVIEGSQDIRQWATLGDQFVTTLARLNLGYNPATVRANADFVRAQIKQLRLLKVSVPIFGPIIGLVLVIVGLFLVLRKGRKPAEGPAPDAQPAPAG